MKTEKRIGLLGGTFNPVHSGHIELGQKAMDRFNLDSILYILSAIPPHKSGSGVIDASLRWQMLKSALLPFDNFIPSDIEINRKTYSWTIDTLNALKKDHPLRNMFFISGSEGFLKIRTWKSYKKLLASLNFIIAVRKESQRRDVIELLESEDIKYTGEEIIHTNYPMAYIFSYNSDIKSISSTLIRKKIKEGLDISKMVPEVIKKFISEHHLYE